MAFQKFNRAEKFEAVEKELVAKTIAQQDAKRKTAALLRERGLTLPPDLQNA